MTPVTPAEAPKLLSIREAALELRLSKDVLYEMAAVGEIDHYRLRGRIFIPREAIGKYLKASFYPAKRQFFKSHRTNLSASRELR